MRIHFGAINIEHLLFAIVVSNYYGRLMCRHLFCIMLQPVQDIGFIGIHTKPTEAEKEVDRLVDVYDTVSEKFQTEVPLLSDYLL